MKIKVAVVGGTGYTGSELIRLLMNHPKVDLVSIVSQSKAEEKVVDVLPHLDTCQAMTFSKEIKDPAQVDVVFFATPNGVAMTQVEKMLEHKIRVIDLAADFRLADAQQWKEWYGSDHSCPELLSTAVYGLPECYREQIKSAKIVANPGCYPTSVILGFKPLLESQLINADYLVADSKSGVSGAGRSADPTLSYAECNENFKAYKASAHRHFPEIHNQLKNIASSDIEFAFTPHLLPISRGIHSTLYFRTQASQSQLQRCFEQAYQDEPFVKILEANSHPETRYVRGTNYCLIAVHKQKGNSCGKVLVTIDNLVKGAAGQALQNMNIMFGLDETLGLSSVAIVP